MHILVTNDDGPPSRQASPYILPFVRQLEQAGHTVSVIIPNVQRSWVAKAHIVGQDVVATHYWPPDVTPEVHDDSLTSEANHSNSNSNSNSNNKKDDDDDNGSSNSTQHPWVLLNSTPASCAQVGLSYFFQERGPVELVISGPNYGRNTTALFALSSGTLGAALEAAVCGYRAIALSFAFFDRTNAPDVVAESCKQSVRVCHWLAANASWSDAKLYSVNVPVRADVCARKVVWTKMLQNTWKRGACFHELDQASVVDDPATEEANLRTQEVVTDDGNASATPSANNGAKWRHRHFKWSPRFTEVNESVDRAGPGVDGWVVKHGDTSITALVANFMHAEGYEGEVKL